MNRGEIRAAIFAQADWEPSPSSAEVARVNGFINRALDQVCLEAPFLFFESEITFATQEDVLPDATDTVTFKATDTTVAAGVNAWVLTQDLASTSTAAADWPTNRSWDGRVIEIITSDGTVYRNQIRTIWSYIDSAQEPHKRLTLYKPWPIDVLGAGPFAYRIYTEHYYLPDDVVEFKSARLFHQSYNWPLTVLGQDEAEKRSLADRRTVLAAGQPRAIFRRHHKKIPGPNVAPTVALAAAAGAGTSWLGPEPPGKFDYLVTYTWGKRDTNLRNPGTGDWQSQGPEWEDDGIPNPSVPSEFGDDRSREPLWESAPSPVSASVTVANVGSDQPVIQKAVQIKLPNIEYMQGFLMIGTTTGPVSFVRQNQARSGWHVRIYRRRYTEDLTAYTSMATAGGQYINGLNLLDISDAYYLLAEVRIDSVNDGIFYDTGEFIPDYHKRHRDIHGYQALQMYPKPDTRYEVDVRCIRRPQKLDSDQDVPPVHAEVADMIIHRALMLFYEHEGNFSASELARARYDRNLAAAVKRYSDMRPASEPIVRQFTRARRGASAHGGIRRWWDTDT